MIKKFDEFNKIDEGESFRPMGVKAPAFWGSKEDLRKIIMNELKNDPNLTLNNYVELNKSYFNRLSADDQKEYNEVIERLNIPYFQKVRT